MGALFRLLLIAGLGYLVFQFLRTRLLQARGDESPSSPRRPAGPRLIAFERPPWQVLGLEPDCSTEEVQAAYTRLRDANSPEKLAGMSDELRALAERRTQELDDAYARLMAAQGDENH